MQKREILSPSGIGLLRSSNFCIHIRVHLAKLETNTEIWWHFVRKCGNRSYQRGQKSVLELQCRKKGFYPLFKRFWGFFIHIHRWIQKVQFGDILTKKIVMGIRRWAKICIGAPIHKNGTIYCL